ncbi:vicilin-like seed storage protein At2g18540 [Trichoplusia ni]|uniref:Vicilin-like seed storage protein At2g18540 n=1 Tax=Trichoplusia ni TaxID=7111 RepID=A0A7E5VAV1_TRINI|nr:vicilin-like seed storage protein At2g18540 [Trichoplusia ni]XP_026725406.1 vicilin-like seed storage protein At2g18540 [Trichoplusia ni]XP_026725407.1 vicilin-like seed storage protein At2g18540 [Trichoplusia ni]
MPPDMAISMRHTKLKAEEAALLAGELNKPSWESRNEGIHERVSFEDSIWGFDLAGGVYYKTPLRVTYVKPDSRAEKAGIRAGDKLLRINDVDTSTLTIQQAHDIIIESGIHLKLSVTSPDDEEDAYYCYEDPILDGYDSEEERRREEEKARKRRVCARVSHFWSLQWPWVSKRRLIYRESNCFMVPSKYEEARRDKYPPLPVLRYTDEIVHFSADQEKENKKRIPSLTEVKEKARKARQERLANGDAVSDITDDGSVRNMDEDEKPADDESMAPLNEEESKQEDERNVEEMKEATEPENKEESNVSVDDEVKENADEEIKESSETADEVVNDAVESAPEEKAEEPNDLLSPIPEAAEERNLEMEQEPAAEEGTENGDVVMNGDLNDDEMINEVLGKSNENVPRGEEDNILDSILSDEGQNLENSESNNER